MPPLSSYLDYTQSVGSLATGPRGSSREKARCRCDAESRFIEAPRAHDTFRAGDLTTITYGLLIVAFLTLQPRGIVGIADRLRRSRDDENHASTPKLTVTTPKEAHP